VLLIIQKGINTSYIYKTGTNWYRRLIPTKAKVWDQEGENDMKRRIQKLILIEVLLPVIKAVLEFGANQLPVENQQLVRTEQTTVINQTFVVQPGATVNYTVNNQQTVYNAK
jgi:hypothetical protein